MLNVLGEADGEEGAAAAKQLLDKAYTVPGKMTIFGSLGQHTCGLMKYYLASTVNPQHSKTLADK